jgi:hypothetical protein
MGPFSTIKARESGLTIENEIILERFDRAIRLDFGPEIRVARARTEHLHDERRKPNDSFVDDVFRFAEIAIVARDDDIR